MFVDIVILILGLVLIAAGAVTLVVISLLFSTSFRRAHPERVGPLFLVLVLALLVLECANLLLHSR